MSPRGPAASSRNQVHPFSQKIECITSPNSPNLKSPAKNNGPINNYNYLSLPRPGKQTQRLISEYDKNDQQKISINNLQ